MIVFFLVLFSFQTLMFQTSVHCFFFSTCHALKTWFELSRVESYRNDLTGSKNYFELAGGLSSFEAVRFTNRQKRGGLRDGPLENLWGGRAKYKKNIRARKN